MQALFVTRHGGPQVLELRDQPDPSPAAGEVRVCVRACSVSYADALARQGRHAAAPRPPCVLGYEGAGVVDALGEATQGPAPGTRVVFVSRFGAHQSQVCIPASQVAVLPPFVSFQAAAAMPVDYLTAQHALFEFGHVRPGSHVLVHLAASSVGCAALQLCGAAAGVTVFATAPSSHHAELRALGCHHPIDPATTDYPSEIMRLTQNRGVDLILDPVGGPEWKTGYSLLRPAGLLVVLGTAHLRRGRRWAWAQALWDLARMPRFSPLQLLADGRGIAGVDVARLFDDEALLQRQLRALMGRVANRTFQPRLGQVFAFAEAEAAHRAIEQGTAKGKPVLVPG